MGKKAFLSLFLVMTILVAAGCGSGGNESPPGSGNTLPPSLMVDGSLYYHTGQKILVKPDESEIRTITSAVPLTELPSKDGETNMHFIHALYARYEEDYVVMIDKVWILFQKKEQVLQRRAMKSSAADLGGLDLHKPPRHRKHIRRVRHPPLVLSEEGGVEDCNVMRLSGAGRRKMMVIREMLEEEYPFLEEMLYASIHVPEGESPYPQNIIEKPELRKYIEGFGRKDDHCLVAEEQGRLVGAVWVRCFTKEDPGYGFVDEAIPELGMAVVEPFRSQGIGTKLIEAMVSHLLSHGYGRVSLSVDGTNQAIRLYRRFGFFDVKKEKGTHTMVLELNPEV